MYKVDIGNIGWLHRLRIQGASGYTIHVNSLPMTTIPSDDFTIDFAEELKQIHALELNYREYLDILDRGNIEEAEEYRRAHPQIQKVYQILIILANQLTPGFDKDFPRTLPTTKQYTALRYARFEDGTPAPAKDATLDIALVPAENATSLDIPSIRVTAE